VGSLRQQASSFIELESRKLKRSAQSVGAEIIASMCIMLVAMTGLVLLLIGLAYILAPSIGLGWGFAISGFVAISAALVCGAVLWKRRSTGHREHI